MVDELLCARSARSSRSPQFQRLVEHRCLISFGKKVMTRSVGNQILTSYVFDDNLSFGKPRLTSTSIDVSFVFLENISF